ILLEVPVWRADMRQKPATLRLVRDQLAIQVLGAPVEQHAAEIEYHRPDVGHPGTSEKFRSRTRGDASRPSPVRQFRYDPRCQNGEADAPSQFRRNRSSNRRALA